jgi:hypothetical protein
MTLKGTVAIPNFFPESTNTHSHRYNSFASQSPQKALILQDSIPSLPSRQVPVAVSPTSKKEFDTHAEFF